MFSTRPDPGHSCGHLQLTGRSLGRVKLCHARCMLRAELLWPVRRLAYAQHGRTEKDSADEPSTGYSQLLCRPDLMQISAFVMKSDQLMP